MEPILHITSAGDWDHAVATGVYEPASLATEGFIHFSFPRQVVQVANAFYRGLPDLVLLVVDPDRLDAPVKLEAPEPGADEFPHLYGALNVGAVTDVLGLVEGTDGFETPPCT